MEYKLTLPLNENKISNIKAGDTLLLSGIIYTARDAAHERLFSAIKKKENLPINLKNACIYYAGPCPAKPNEVIGSCGPTTSARMDKYTPALLDNGLKLIIGKGERNDEVEKSLQKNNALYLAAVGGAGALIKSKIKSSKLIAYEDLLSEAIRELYIEDFPVIVAIDNKGGNLYKSEQAKYKIK